MAVDILPFVFPEIGNVCCAFQCRVHGELEINELPEALSGGNISYIRNDSPERVREVRAELAAYLGFNRVAEAHQVHGLVTLFDAPATSQEPDQILQEADGLATDEIDLALMIKTADCQPVLFAHISGQHLMALHVGWRGNRLAYIQKALASWCATKGILPQDICAVRGPSLGPKKAEFIHFDKEWGKAYAAYFDVPTANMDLWHLTKDQLMEAGLLEHRIYGLDFCTASLDLPVLAASPAIFTATAATMTTMATAATTVPVNKVFFSHRLDPLAGRQASFIWRTA